MKQYLEIYRNNSVNATVEIDARTVFSAAINAENKVTAQFTSETPIEIAIRDFIYVDGFKYQINKFTDMDISSKYEYNVVFEATSYSLFNKPYNTVSSEPIFKKFGTVTEFIDTIISQINGIDSGWTKGTIEDNGKQLEVSFVGDSCRTALRRICDAFGMELNIVNKEINVVKSFVNPDATIVLRYGRGNGLYRLSRKVEGDFFTRVVGIGSSNNLPVGYRGGAERLTFNPGYVDIPNAATYGTPIILEVEFNDVFPHRTGTITSVPELYKVVDTSIDFNLADNFITGVTPAIVMQSGILKGQQFDIVTTSYNYASQSFKIKPNQERAGNPVPNVTLNIQAGDTYVFIGINLPQSYVDAAESQLQSLTAAYALTESELTISYVLELDPIHVLKHNLSDKLKLGAKVNIVNAPTGINENLRVVSVQYPLIAPELKSVQIADKIPFSAEKQIRKIVIETAREITEIKDNITKVKAFSNQRLDEALGMIFDSSGDYFDPIHIRALSIEAPMIVAGQRPQSLSLSVVFDPNTSSNPNYFTWSAGKLTHFTVDINGPYTWDIPSGSVSGLVSATSYYIYARCNKANNNGVIVLDTAQRKVDSDSTYWYFLLGSVSSVISGIRWPDLSYGMSKLNGGFLSTGTILAQDGTPLVNVDNGELIGRISFVLPDGELKAISALNSETIDALSKATSAKAKTDILKSLAFEDKVELAKLGTTIIEGGYLKNTLIDTVELRALLITVTYLQGLELNFTRGTIGGIDIASNGLLGEKFSIIEGVLTAIDAFLENITVDGMNAVNATISGTTRTSETGQRVELDGATNSLRFYDAGGLKVEISSNIVTGLGTYSGIRAGNYVLSEGGFSHVASLVTMNSNAVKIGDFTDAMSLVKDGFNITKGGSSFTPKTASITIMGTTLNVVNGLIVN